MVKKPKSIKKVKRSSNQSSNKKKTKKKTNTIENVLLKNLTCNSITDLLNTVNIVNSLGQGSTGHSLKLCNDTNCEYPIAAKFSKISTRFPFNEKHPVKVEMAVQKIVNKLVKEKICPHFNQSFGESIVCNTRDLNKIDYFVNYFKEFQEGTLTPSQKKNIFEGIDKVSVSFMELGESDLFEYLLKNSKTISLSEMKAIIFQVYYSLMVLQYHEPGFKHLDLKTDNILVFKPDPKKTKGKFNKYIIGDREYFLNAEFIQIKIFDFDFAVSDKIDNSKIRCELFGNIGLSREHNPVQDNHYFINFLLNFRKEYYHYKNSIIEFLKTLLPSNLSGKQGTNSQQPIVKYRLSNYNQTGDYENCNYVPPKGEILTPAECLIESEIFNEFLKSPKKNKIANTFNSKVNVDKAKKRTDMFIIH